MKEKKNLKQCKTLRNNGINKTTLHKKNKIKS